MQNAKKPRSVIEICALHAYPPYILDEQFTILVIDTSVAVTIFE